LRKSACMTKEQIITFGEVLKSQLVAHYSQHWYPEFPLRGSGYRCLRNTSRLNPLIAYAGSSAGLSEKDLKRLLPGELAIWVDPREVTFRIGDEGSVGILYQESSSPGQSSPASKQKAKPICRNEEFESSPFSETVRHIPAMAALS